MAIKKSAPARSASGVIETKNNIVAEQPAEKLTGKQETQVKKKILLAEADPIAKTGTDVKGVAVDEQAVQIAQDETVSQADASSASSVVSNAGQADQSASVSHEAVAGKTGYSPWLLGTALVGGLAAAAGGGGGGGGGSKGGDGGGPAPQPAAQFKGTVIDGYIKGADVFLVDRNGKEIATGQKTDDRGNFSINNPDGLAVKIKGGVNVDTGAANTLELYAPAGQSGKVMVTPLTTLVHKLVTEHGMSSQDAKALVQKALGLKGDADLLTQDPIEAKNLEAHKAAVKLATVIAGVGAGSVAADKVLADVVVSIKSNLPQDLNQTLKALVERHAGSEKSATVDLQMKAIDAAADFQKIAESQKAIAGDAIPPEKAHIDVTALVGAEAAKSPLVLKVKAASDAETVVVKFNGQVLVADGKGAYSIDASKLADGDYKVEVISADKAGNASIGSQTITIDTTAPVVEIQALGAQAGFSKGFTVNAGAVVTGVDLAKFDKSSKDGVDTYIAKAGAFKGDEVLKLDASLTDAAGNEGKVAGVELKIDSTAPAQPTIALKIDSGAAGDKITNDAALVISPADGVSRVVKVDGVKVDTYDASKLAEGKHTVEVVDTDAAGNSVSSGAFTFELAKTAPTVELKAIAGEGGFSHGFTVNAGAVVTGVDLAKFDKTSKDGIDTYIAKAGAFKGDEILKLGASLTDAAGNEGKEVGVELKIDSTAPVQPTIALKVDSGAVGDKVTNDATLDISLVEDGVSRVVKLDGVKVDGYDESKLSQGKHTVEVIDTDAAGNSASSGAFTFELDKTVPTVELKAIAGEGGFSHGFTVSAGAVVTGVDLAKFDKTSKGGIDTYIAKDGVFDGETLSLNASWSDKLGNIGHAIGLSLVIDNIAPVNTKVVVNELVNAEAAKSPVALQIETAKDVAKVAVEFNGKVVEADGKGSYYLSVNELSDGEYKVFVTSTDKAGNVATTEKSIVIDKTPPQVDIDLISPNHDLVFIHKGFTVTEGAVVAVVVNGAVIDLGKFDKTTQNGRDSYVGKPGVFWGDEKVTVNASLIDAAGNVGKSSAVDFLIDTRAPEAPTIALKVDSGVVGDNVTNNAALEFSQLAPGVIREISVNGHKLPYYDPAWLDKNGHYVIEVNDSDPIGNTVSGKYEFDLYLASKLAKPTVDLAVDSGIVGDKITNDATLNISPAMDGVSRVVKLDGVKVDGYDASKLAEGKHTVEIVDTDAGGNGVSSGEFAFELVKSAPLLDIRALYIDGQVDYSKGFSVTAGATVTGVDLAKFDKSSHDGLDFYIAKNNAFNGEILLANASLIDAAGNESKAFQRFMVDTTPPDVRVFPLGLRGGFSHGFTVTIGSKVTGVDLTKFVMTTDYRSWDNYEAKKGEFDGEQVTITASQKDKVGNVGQAEISIKFDTTPPVVELHAIPHKGDYSSGFTVTKGAEVRGPLDKFDKVVDSTGKLDVYIAKNGAFDGESPIISASLKDAAGNVGEAIIQPKIDTTAPHLGGIRSVGGRGDFAYGFSVDAGAEVTGVDLTKFVKSFDAAKQLDVYTAHDGAFNGELVTISARLEDAAGNMSDTISGSFRIDTQAPDAPGFTFAVGNSIKFVAEEHASLWYSANGIQWDGVPPLIPPFAHVFGSYLTHQVDEAQNVSAAVKTFYSTMARAEQYDIQKSDPASKVVLRFGKGADHIHLEGLAVTADTDLSGKVSAEQAGGDVKLTFAQDSGFAGSLVLHNVTLTPEELHKPNVLFV
ncbi:Ig-like domain-containing protein [Chromobacterium vaccinii]|uniref:Ig-like domain-containing protein n=1 Tax=Chromobacterium vaccinii TaxID=1108595 RepID=UPI0006180625|nr:Ig-like domain-containing protein [Chromobacterium vaccinii]